MILASPSKITPTLNSVFSRITNDFTYGESSKPYTSYNILAVGSQIVGEQGPK